MRYSNLIGCACSATVLKARFKLSSTHTAYNIGLPWNAVLGATLQLNVPKRRRRRRRRTGGRRRKMRGLAEGVMETGGGIAMEVAR